MCVYVFHRYYLHAIPQNKSLTIQQQTKIDRKNAVTTAKSTASDKHSNSDLVHEIEMERDDHNDDDEGDDEDEDEEWFNGERISLTFRTISTFLHHDGTLSGQGAPSCSLADATATASHIAHTNSVHDDDVSILAPSDVPVCIRSGEYNMNGANSCIRDKVVWIRHRQLRTQQKQDSITAAAPAADEVIQEKRRLLEAFSAENRQAGVLWEEIYGGGFAVW